MKACCPFCRTWNATYTFRDLPVPYQGPFWCGGCDTKLTVDGYYHCTRCGGTLLFTIPRGETVPDILRGLPKAVLAAGLVTAFAAALRFSISQELLVYIAAGIMGVALLLWLLRLPLLRLASLPSRKHARPAPETPVLVCGHCGHEAGIAGLASETGSGGAADEVL